MPLIIKSIKLHNFLHIVTNQKLNLEMKVADRRVEAFMGDLDDFGGEKGPQVATKS